MAAALTVLFRADPLTPSRVDPHFTHEAAAVRELGGAVALVDHDALTAGDTNTAVRRVAPGLGHVWYRGTPASVWMPAEAGTSPSAAEVAQLIEPLGPLNKLRVELHATVIVESDRPRLDSHGSTPIRRPGMDPTVDLAATDR